MGRYRPSGKGAITRRANWSLKVMVQNTGACGVLGEREAMLCS